MILVVAGTNRRMSKTLPLARVCQGLLREAGAEVELLDLMELPGACLDPDAYFMRPPEFAPFQEAFDRCAGVLTVVPEYNGSFPGALKLMIDMLEFPRTLNGVPSAFVGLAAGRWGGIRPVEQLEQVFSYRKALLYNQRSFVPSVYEVIDEEGALTDEALGGRLATELQGFLAFVARNPRPAPEPAEGA